MRAVSPVPPSYFNDGHPRRYEVDRPRRYEVDRPRNASAAVRAVSPPPCNFDRHSQRHKGDHARSLNVSPAQKVRAVSPVPPSYFNDGHPRRYEVDRLRNASAASQRSARPSVSQFTKNPAKWYLDFVLVMVISTGKLEVLSWREASEKGKQVKIVST